MLLTRTLLLFFLLASGMHYQSVGLVNVEIDNVDEVVYGVFKLNKNSLKMVFQHNYLFNIDFENNELSEKSTLFLNDYINKSFLLKANDKVVEINVSAHKVEGEEVWLYFREALSCKTDSILVRNLLLLDTNIDHKNIVLVKAGDFEKGILLDKNDFKANFNLTGLYNEK